MTLTRLATVAQHLLTAAPAPEQQQVPRAKDPVRPKRAAGTAGEETPTILPELERWRADLPALKEQFNRDGFVLVSGLIPEAVISAAEDVVWAAMEEESEHWLSGDAQGGFQRGAPSTWPAEPKQFAKTIAGPEISALWTDEYRSMVVSLSTHFEVDQSALGGPGGPALPEAPITQPKGALAINILPQTVVQTDDGASSWSTPSPHIDHSIEAHAFRSFPVRPVRMSTMTYLTDAPADLDKHGGSTVGALVTHLDLVV